MTWYGWLGVWILLWAFISITFGECLARKKKVNYFELVESDRYTCMFIAFVFTLIISGLVHGSLIK